jgi:hypothetical protein
MKTQITGKSRRRMTIESPLAGGFDSNVAYARACLRNALLLGQAPFASQIRTPDTPPNTPPDTARNALALAIPTASN